MSGYDALTTLIRRGRRRQVRNLLIHQASFSFALALGGAVLLLLLGTQILNWYWPVLLFAVSLAAGIYRARNQVRSPYQVAQSMDSQLGTHDSLSTALYFDQHPEHAHAQREFIEHQRTAANDLARSADLHRGVPFIAPRTFYANAVLALVVCGMFGLRYGINRSLDLRASLVHIGLEDYFGTRAIADAKKLPGQRPFDQDGRRDNGMAVDPWVSQPGELDAATDAALTTTDTPEVNNADNGPQASAKTKATGKEPEPPAGDPLDSGEEGKSSQPGSESNADQNSAPDGSQQGKQSPQKAANQAPGENSSLTDKMRDALANLLAKMKLQPKNGEGRQSGSQSQNNSQQAQKPGQSQDPNSSSQQGQQQSDANSSAQSQGQQSQSGQQQAAQGKGDSHSADRPNSPDGKSGIGRQDGDKSAREAEQLAAMGKISEIIGKRSANVTGEVMVEVASGKQQLKTQYSQRKAAHGEAGGEINRDEVPLAYQQYVQQYFEEIRKLPASKSKTDGKPRNAGQ